MQVTVELDKNDIPRAALSACLESHTVRELKWWFLCWGIKTSTTIRKAQVMDIVLHQGIGWEMMEVDS